MTGPHKHCTCCGELKPFSEFYRHPGRRYGLHPRCKRCHIDAVRKSRGSLTLASRAKWAAIAEESAL